MHDFSTEYRLSDGTTTFLVQQWIDDIKAQAWNECAEEAYDRGMLHDITFEDMQTLNPYRQVEKIVLSNEDYDQLRKALDEE